MTGQGAKEAPPPNAVHTNIGGTRLFDLSTMAEADSAESTGHECGSCGGEIAASDRYCSSCGEEQAGPDGRGKGNAPLHSPLHRVRRSENNASTQNASAGSSRATTRDGAHAPSRDGRSHDRPRLGLRMSQRHTEEGPMRELPLSTCHETF